MRFAAVIVLSALAAAQTPTNPNPPTSTMYTLALVGISANGSSTSGPTQQYFTEFNVISPLNCFQGHVTHPLQHKCWLWFNPRIASVPSSGSTALGALTSSAALPSGLTGQTIGQITQSIELQGGVEFYLKSPWEGAQFGRNNSFGRTAVSLIAGGGMVTPFSSNSAAPEFGLNASVAQQFNQNSSLAAQYPQLASALCNYGYSAASCPKIPPAAFPSSVAFVPSARSRFYRDFYAGIRLRTFYLKGICPDPSLRQPEPDCKLENSFPSTFDIRFGEDETVTAGRLVPLVMTLAANYPLPGTAGTVRIFGSVYLRLRANQESSPLILIPPSTYAALDQSSVVVQPVPASDRDYYRLGLGVDLVPLIAKWAGK